MAGDSDTTLLALKIDILLSHVAALNNLVSLFLDLNNLEKEMVAAISRETRNQESTRHEKEMVAAISLESLSQESIHHEKETVDIEEDRKMEAGKEDFSLVVLLAVKKELMALVKVIILALVKAVPHIQGHHQVKEEAIAQAVRNQEDRLDRVHRILQDLNRHMAGEAIQDQVVVLSPSRL